MTVRIFSRVLRCGSGHAARYESTSLALSSPVIAGTLTAASPRFIAYLSRPDILLRFFSPGQGFRTLSGGLHIEGDVVGTWKFNLERSKLENDDGVAETMTIEQTGSSTYRNRLDMTLKLGTKGTPGTGPSVGRQGASLLGRRRASDESELCKTADDGSRILTGKSGKITIEIRSSLSSYGCTLTHLRTHPGGGQETLVFDKQ